MEKEENMEGTDVEEDIVVVVTDVEEEIVGLVEEGANQVVSEYPLLATELGYSN